MVIEQHEVTRMTKRYEMSICSTGRYGIVLAWA